MRKSTPLAGKIHYLLVPRAFGKKDTKVERVGHGQGRLWRQRSPLFWPAVVMTRRPQATVILDFERDGGMMTKNPYGDMFCHIFGRLFDVWV